MFDKTTVSVTLPTIPRQVAEAIEWYREYHDLAEIISRVQIGTYYGEHTAALRSIPFDTLLSALINGYTVEKSAEELEREAHDKIREKYAGFREGALFLSYPDGVADGIECALNTLGIKIEGVNV